MAYSLKFFFSIMMIVALCFGYAAIYFPLENYDFERLHIFLFNLCTGGTILLYFTEGIGRISLRTGLFLALSLFYAFFAFFEIYPMTIIISLGLASIVESLRIERFSIFPSGFFSMKESVSAKFHQASLLCLSIGLIMSTAVIINNEYIHAVTMDKLVLNTFFLGFSFPLSLITLSVIFSMIRLNSDALESQFSCPVSSSSTRLCQQEEITIKSILSNPTLSNNIVSVACFWAINLGVIIFFIFILFEKFYPQLVVTSILFIAVITVFRLYRKFGQKMQQKQFLSSGIGFLIATAITGIVYIFYQMSPEYDPTNTKWLLRIHVFASLYGWNLCGLAVICRFQDFPIRLHSGLVIAIHWLTALVLAPLGANFAFVAIMAVAGYIFIVLTLFFSNVSKRVS
ncbi:MAG: hypothetical protein HQK64_03530 [Desulfamplus sp.]|nr:hypothetical protein [Desulfamplus sp.]MBF0389861.1 hypothetical protein [Desulfamplus sp.]